MAHDCLAWKESALKQAIRDGVLTDENPVFMLYNLGVFRSQIKDLQQSFAPHFLHTFAVKASPVVKILKFVQSCGIGLETASYGELQMALHAGVAPSQIVLDSPAKTLSEIKLCLEKGIHINLDNMQELERISKLIAENKYENISVGVRINPQVGAGSIQAMSTATATSKFGIPLTDLKQEELIEIFRERPWMHRLHCHVGSQGCPLPLIASGVRRTVDLALAVNKALGRSQIDSMDIGGGLPVNFDSEEVSPTFAEYAAVLRQAVPELFDNTFKQVITEFGRALIAKAGVIVSRAEYTKVVGGRHIAMTHSGADLFVRYGETKTVFLPEKWPLRFSVFTPEGERRQATDLVPQDVAGPCCFAGDIIAHERPLPLIEQNDFVMAHDVGGYYHSQYSRYNSRLQPGLYAVDVDANYSGEVTLQTLKKPETFEDLIAFWS